LATGFVAKMVTSRAGDLDAVLNGPKFTLRTFAADTEEMIFWDIVLSLACGRSFHSRAGVGRILGQL
jgi:hypothetical protein